MTIKMLLINTANEVVGEADIPEGAGCHGDHTYVANGIAYRSGGVASPYWIMKETKIHTISDVRPSPEGFKLVNQKWPWTYRKEADPTPPCPHTDDEGRSVINAMEVCDRCGHDFECDEEIANA